MSKQRQPSSYPDALTAVELARAPGRLRAFLENIAARREFRQSLPVKPDVRTDKWAGFGGNLSSLSLPGLQLTGAQTFIRDFASPNAEYLRLLIKWQTGAGKSIAAISICHEFAAQYRARAQVGDRAPHITILGFTTRETILEDMLRFPEFGFVSAAEVLELRNLRMLGNSSASAGPSLSATAAIRHLAGFLGVLRRRVTDRARGGYYQFYGYKEFANRLFRTTRAASARGQDAESLLFARALGARASAEPFGARLAEAVRRGDVEIDRALLDSLKGGLLVCDEIHNVYNILEPNNYGAAIQYALDVLGDVAPRAVFMSATPVTGSAAEVVDLLNLLVPRSALPDNTPLRRADFFTRGRTAASEALNDTLSDAPNDTLSEALNNTPIDALDMGELIETQITVSQLRPDALERIRHLSAGRVSFLLDADVNAYPKRIFEGEELPGVPYLKLTPCELPPLLARTLQFEQARQSSKTARIDSGATRGLQADAYTLNDIAFPNPAFAQDDPESIGLYRSGNTISELADAPLAWRQAQGVIIETATSSRTSSRSVSGTWLQADQLIKYSSKYHRLLADIMAVLRSPPAQSGKIMVYHHRVHMSGVILLAEILRMNGFATETSEVTEQTICAVCGVARSAHTAAHTAAHIAAHTYMPARFAVAHSDIDRAEMLRSISRFNSVENLDGYLCRVLIGSKVVREGLNFRAVRHMFVMSMPTDYPTLLQVFGRVVRKDSHRELPAAQRDVRIRVYVGVLGRSGSDRAPQATPMPPATPELQRYIDKGQEFLVIQRVEQALHAGAVDGYINYNRIRTALGAPPESAPPSLDALPYQLALNQQDAIALNQTSVTFDAYGYGQRIMMAAVAACRALFMTRPVWTYPDLRDAIRKGAVRGSGIDASAFAERDIAAALIRLHRPSQWPDGVIAAVTRAGPYYIVTAVESTDVAPHPDIETWLRGGRAVPRPPSHVSVSVGAFMRSARARQNFNVHLREFEKKYLQGTYALELSLVELGGAFHYELLRRLTVAAATGASTTSRDGAVIDLYRRFHIGITAAEALAVPAGDRLKKQGIGRNTLVGYTTTEYVTIYDAAAQRWFNAPLSEFKLGRRHKENDIVVGFVVPIDETGTASAGARFKLRPALQVLQRRHLGSSKTVDVRTIARGAVCETRPREELDGFVKKLRAALPRKLTLHSADLSGHSADLSGHSADHWVSTATPVAAIQNEVFEPQGSEWPAAPSDWPADMSTDQALSFAVRYDRTREKRFPSASELCSAVRLYLLALEEHSRNINMQSSIRWIYLFADKPPSVASLGSA